jgi:phosphoribosylamine--glycine ligase
MRVLVVGSGGREHAIIWKLIQSPKVDKVYCAPGNGGISNLAECVNISAEDLDGLLNFALSNKIDLTVVGPEVPLVDGIVDKFEEKGLKCFGPAKDAAQIEGSKVFSKNLMKKYNIPTAAYEKFTNSREAIDYLKGVKYPVVIKADGLAAGKGVIIAENPEMALNAVVQMMDEKLFSSAGDSVIIEEFITGPEVSVLAFTDGKCIKPMVSAKDHKRVYDNDLGPNTGGMGTISPNPYYDEETSQKCMKEIFIPTMEAMNREGRPFKGVLFFGLMLTEDGPKVLEYNCRFGDPETQVVIPRLKTDIVDIMLAVIDEKLNEIEIEWDRNAACCVIAASGGYPGKYEKGKIIEGLRSLPEDITVFHSGTRLKGNELLTDGGRVLGITAMGDTPEDAASRVYNYIDNIKFEGMHYRRDIDR